MIAGIEDAIVAHLKAASETAALGYRLATVATYAGEFDGDLKLVVRNFPAVWVAFLNAPRPESLGDGQFQHAPVFVVMCAARSVRSERATRHGADGDVGSYQILKDVRALLIGRTLGLEIGRFDPGAVRPLLASGARDSRLSVLALELHTEYVDEAALDEGAVGSFQNFHADWDIPPLGNVTAPLPAADADAADDLTLAGA